MNTTSLIRRGTCEWEVPQAMFVEMSAVASYQELLEGLRRFGRDVLAKAKAAAAGAGLEADSTLREVAQGRIADVIVSEARGASCDLIVMGTHGRRGFSRVATGSDAEQVVRASPVPVLLVRREEAQPPASLPKPPTMLEPAGLPRQCRGAGLLVVAGRCR